jgi:hypothetical protein
MDRSDSICWTRTTLLQGILALNELKFENAREEVAVGFGFKTCSGSRDLALTPTTSRTNQLLLCLTRDHNNLFSLYFLLFNAL